MKKIKRSCKGRKCRFPNCRSILSIYNHGDYCHVHMGQHAAEHKHRVCK